MGKYVKQGSKYTDKQRRQAVIEMHTLGNLTRVSERLDIPATTLGLWSRQEWYEEVSIEVRAQVSARILEQNLAVATSAGDAVLDRLEGGDYVYRKQDGKDVLMRIPMKGRDCAIVGGIAQDHARVQMGLATSITKSESMSSLARQFQELSRQIDSTVVSTQPKQDNP